MNKHQHEHDPLSMKRMACGAMPWLASTSLCFVLLPGCVSVEKYEAEKTRAINFQRLLAQEEHRADELNTQLREANIKVESLESKKDELAIELDSLQLQASRRQPGAPSGSAPAMSGAVNTSDDMSFSETSLAELGLPDLSFKEPDFQEFNADDDGNPSYHTVMAGETLYRLSRNYGVTIAQLKEWNNLTGNLISIGQRLIVSTP